MRGMDCLRRGRCLILRAKGQGGERATWMVGAPSCAPFTACKRAPANADRRGANFDEKDREASGAICLRLRTGSIWASSPASAPKCWWKFGTKRMRQPRWRQEGGEGRGSRMPRGPMRLVVAGWGGDRAIHFFAWSKICPFAGRRVKVGHGPARPGLAEMRLATAGGIEAWESPARLSAWDPWNKMALAVEMGGKIAAKARAGRGME